MFGSTRADRRQNYCRHEGFRAALHSSAPKMSSWQQNSSLRSASEYSLQTLPSYSLAELCLGLVECLRPILRRFNLPLFVFGAIQDPWKMSYYQNETPVVVKHNTGVLRRVCFAPCTHLHAALRHLKFDCRYTACLHVTECERTNDSK